MKNLRILAAILITFYSCNYRIFINDRYDHKENGMSSNYESISDSCFILDINDTIPNDATLINKTTIASPFFWFIMHSPKYVMTKKAQAQAKRVNANIMQIVSGHSTKFSRYFL
jgi:hypothetical protein